MAAVTAAAVPPHGDGAGASSASRKASRLAPGADGPASSFDGGPPVGGGTGQERIVETLSKFLMPREVEVLSLRYGLVPSSTTTTTDKPDEGGDAAGRAESSSAIAAASSPTTTTTTTSSTRGRPGRRPAFRDYEAEAEEGLFGPNGMLSHYAIAPNDGDGVVATTTSASAAPAKLNNRNDRRFSSTTSTATATVAATAAAASSAHTSASARVKEATAMAMAKSANNSLLPFKEVGKRMKFSGEYCRRTCSVALSKLSRAVEEGRLAESDFLLGW